jgi:hypothetical protein
MPDLRETELLNQIKKSRGDTNAARRPGLRLKSLSQRFVVATSQSPLRVVYLAIYRWHVSYAVRMLRAFPGLHSIYVTRSMAIQQIQPGVSDIDLSIYGDWTEEQLAPVRAAVQRLSRWSPLFDRNLAQSTQTLNEAQTLYATDYYFRHRLDEGRTEWKLLYGHDLFALLPPRDVGRAAGGYYMDLRLWWSNFIKTAFAFGPMADDEVFRISIPYKVAAHLLNAQNVLAGGPPQSSRRDIMQAALQTRDGAQRQFLERLVQSAATGHRGFAGDILEESLPFLLETFEAIHARIRATSAFGLGSTGGAVRIDGSATELLVSPSARSYAQQVQELVKSTWTGYRSSYLISSMSFFNLDDLVLLLEVDAGRLPTVAQIRQLCRYALDHAGSLPQRVALFLLLPEGAYQLELVSSIEQWHHTLCPSANPEVFAFLDRPEFLLDGEPRPSAVAPVWSRFANDLVDEEISIRRAALGKIAATGNIASLDLLRNLWRHLQLEIVQRSAREGVAILPMTVAAVERNLDRLGIGQNSIAQGSIFARLREAYESEIQGRAVDIRPLLPELMGLFAAFSAQPPAQG